MNVGGGDLTRNDKNGTNLIGAAFSSSVAHVPQDGNKKWDETRMLPAAWFPEDPSLKAVLNR